MINKCWWVLGLILILAGCRFSERAEDNATANVRLIAFTDLRITEDRSISEIYVIGIDGTGLQRLTDTPDIGGSSDPDWAPNRDKLLFIRQGNIYLLELDSKEIIQLTKDYPNIFSPTWSPDGQRLIFNSDRDGNLEVYVMDIDGSNVIRLTNNPFFDAHPAWSPDGRHMVFESMRDNEAGLFIMDDSGRNITLLFSGIDPKWPAWQP